MPQFGTRGPQGLITLPVLPQGVPGQMQRRLSQPNEPLLSQIPEVPMPEAGGLITRAQVESQAERQAKLDQLQPIVPNQGNPVTLALIENQKAQVAEQMGVPIEDAEADFISQIAATTAPVVTTESEEGESSGFDYKKLNSQIDLMTVGLAILAGNDGSQSISQLLGNALNMGVQSAAGKKDLARKADLEERRVEALESGVVVDAFKAQSNAAALLNKARPSGIPSAAQRDAVGSVLSPMIGVDLKTTGDDAEQDHIALATIVSGAALSQQAATGEVWDQNRLNSFITDWVSANQDVINERMFRGNTVDREGLAGVIQSGGGQMSSTEIQLEQQIQAKLDQINSRNR